MLCGELTEARGGGKSQNRPVSDTEMIRVRDDGILPQPIVLKGRKGERERGKKREREEGRKGRRKEG